MGFFQDLHQEGPEDQQERGPDHLPVARQEPRHVRAIFFLSKGMFPHKISFFFTKENNQVRGFRLRKGSEREGQGCNACIRHKQRRAGEDKRRFFSKIFS